MHHLWKEHSSECLLSSTEFIQFQYLIMYHENTISIALNNDECEIDNNDLNQLHPDIPQSSIVFGNNPTNKISTYIINKLTGDNIPQITHKKSIFNASQKLAINQTIIITRNIATVISPSKSKHKLLYQQQLNEHTHSNSKPILAMSAPNRKRHSISGKLFLSKSHSKKDIIKSSNKKQQTHRRSLSGNNINKKQPLSLNPKSKSTPSETHTNNNNNANSAFQLQLEMDTSDLLQGFEPKSPLISNKL